VTAVFRAQQITTQKHEVSVQRCATQFFGRIPVQQSPAVTGADNRVVAELNHARILGTAEGIGVNQFRRLRPGFAIVVGANQDEITVGIGMAGARFAESAAFRSSAEGDQELTTGTANEGREGAVEFVIVVNDNVVEFPTLSSFVAADNF